MICSVLRGAGIECFHRKTDFAAAAWEGVPYAGPREVLVSDQDLEAAHAALATVEQ